MEAGAFAAADGRPRGSEASRIACDVIRCPKDPRYGESIRKFQGCPTIAVTRNGRIYLGWYSGGVREPDMDNYNLLVYSDDGRSWSDPILVIPSNREKYIHALDIQLWISPDNRLYVYWVQNSVKPAPDKMPVYPASQPAVISDGFLFDDFEHAEWMICCENPDADNIQFSKPKYLYKGFLRCKPLVLQNGSWLHFNYNQLDTRYGCSVSRDRGQSFTYYYGSKKILTQFDEAMAYERMDGSVRMLARSSVGELAESISYNGGKTWSEAKLSGIANPGTRFFVSRTPSGRILLINNDCRTNRTNMTVYLSEDDGATWKYKRLIDNRNWVSYPDADFYNGKIYMVYDRDRLGAKEILFLSFSEENVMDGAYQFCPLVISPPEFIKIEG